MHFILRIRLLLTSTVIQQCEAMRNFSYFETKICQFTEKVPSNIFVVNQLIACGFYGVLFVLIVLLNSISILTISRSSQLKEKVCYFLILLQSVVDLIFGLIVLPLLTAYSIDRDITRTQNEVICWLYHTIGFYPMALSLLMLCGLSFERYMGIVYPLVHRTKVTKRRMFMFFCFASLLSSLIFSSFAERDLSLPRITFTTGGIMCLLFIIFVYISIFLTARKRLNPRNRPGVAALKDDSQTKLKIRFIRELKLAKSCFLVVCTFGFCFLPSMILASSLFSYVERDTFLGIWSWAHFSSGLNCCFNSLIFFWSKPVLRKEATKVLNKCCCSELS